MDLIVDAAQVFLTQQANATDPFFLYLPFQNIHAPYTTQPQFYKQYDQYTNLTDVGSGLL